MGLPESPIFSEDGSTAIGGYDTVAYFQGRPRQGLPGIIFQYRGLEWRFSSEENRSLFQQNPEQYLPQYGGWCAWAVSQGGSAPSDPRIYNIIKGKLYLQYSESTRRSFLAETDGNIAKADGFWVQAVAKWRERRS